MPPDTPTDADRAAVLALLDRLGAAHATKDAAAIAACYAPDAVIYDLAPPLGRRGMEEGAVQAWLDTWEGPIAVEARDLTVTAADGIACLTAISRMAGRQGGAASALWFRTTHILARGAQGWRIVHEHASVPFYMDGSLRAAVDLEPVA
jgi:uncharacterized protein (TIGR02246 family)